MGKDFDGMDDEGKAFGFGFGSASLEPTELLWKVFAFVLSMLLLTPLPPPKSWDLARLMTPCDLKVVDYNYVCFCLAGLGGDLDLMVVSEKTYHHLLANLKSHVASYELHIRSQCCRNVCIRTFDHVPYVHT
mmetsp:Transcript_2400/g.3339  ORF Transcript_2400/g.3339 Transcript_2400/m.3339 type:complete len:132 (-) Transcript_2400:341-736(-)